LISTPGGRRSLEGLVGAAAVVVETFAPGVGERLGIDLGPLYRFYETADGWLCVVAPGEEEWRALAGAVGRPELCDDLRFADPRGRDVNGAALAEELGSALAEELGSALAAKPAAVWFAVLDDAGVPCEVVLDSPPDDRSSGGSVPPWFADPDAVANRWVVSNEHPVWGRLDQPGGLVDLSGFEPRSPGPPPIVGAQTPEILAELGYSHEEIESLRTDGVVAW
jgi:crotonobetainyl-CoA:carnitine CoA-transferase CaiB-like acyl-CoA transferase